MVPQDASETGRPLVVGLSVRAGERDDALLAVLVEAAVADEVEDVPGALLQRLLEVLPRLPGEPRELDQAFRT